MFFEVSFFHKNIAFGNGQIHSMFFIQNGVCHVKILLFVKQHIEKQWIGTLFSDASELVYAICDKLHFEWKIPNELASFSMADFDGFQRSRMLKVTTNYKHNGFATTYFLQIHFFDVFIMYLRLDLLFFGHAYFTSLNLGGLRAFWTKNVEWNGPFLTYDNWLCVCHHEFIKTERCFSFTFGTCAWKLCLH